MIHTTAVHRQPSTNSIERQLPKPHSAIGDKAPFSVQALAAIASHTVHASISARSRSRFRQLARSRTSGNGNSGNSGSSPAWIS